MWRNLIINGRNVNIVSHDAYVCCLEGWQSDALFQGMCSAPQWWLLSAGAAVFEGLCTVGLLLLMCEGDCQWSC